jgi:hypothetical protein
MRYVEPLVGFVAFLLFLIGSILASRSTRDWTLKAEILLGLSGAASFGLILYERYSSGIHHFVFLKALLGGIAIGVFVTLWLGGSLNVLNRLKRGVPGGTRTGRGGA